MVHVGIALQRHHLVDFDAARFADPAEVVAFEIDQHHVLGTLLRIRKQLDRKPVVVVAIRRPGPGSGDRPRGRDTVTDLEQPFGRRGDDRAVPPAGQSGKRRRIGAAQRGIQLHRVALVREARGPAAGQVGLVDVAGGDVVLCPCHGVQKALVVVFLRGRVRSLPGALRGFAGRAPDVAAGPRPCRWTCRFRRQTRSACRRGHGRWRPGSARQTRSGARRLPAGSGPVRFPRRVRSRGRGTSRRGMAVPGRGPAVVHSATIRRVPRESLRNRSRACRVTARLPIARATRRETRTGCRSGRAAAVKRCFAGETGIAAVQGGAGRANRRALRAQRPAGRRRYSARTRRQAQSNARKIRLPLVPPKPNEFEMAIVIFASRASLGT